MPGPGRPRDAARTRAQLVAAARRHFAAEGYDRVTVRAIAAEAGVSPNLVTRYFGGKRGLLAAATDVDLHVERAFPGGHRGLGHRLAVQVVDRWEAHTEDDPLLLMLRAAMTDPEAAARMADFFDREALQPLAAHLGGADAERRAGAVSALIMGTVLQRYVLRAGPAATGDRHRVEAWLGHALERLLTGPSFADPS